MMLRTQTVLSIFAVLLAGSPSNQAEEPTTEQLQFFEQKVRPLLVTQCYECHSSQSEKLNGGLQLDHRNGLLSGGDNGPAVVPGKPAESLLIKAIHYDESGMEMPPSGKLKPHEVELLEKWVAMGAPFPQAAAVTKERKVIDIEAGKKHWAFQPLRENIDLPIANSANNRLDALVKSSQLAHHEQALDQASRATLVRRIKFDLLGLPPTIDEVEQFQADEHEDALARLVDTWLSSPRYGERWARHWLELVRYCDVAESWAETQGNSYFYRDWVVKAFNDDMPFDRFSKLQLAADSLPEAKPEDMAALGFIGLAPTYWKELQLPVEIIKTIVADEYEERIHTFSSTFFGLNMACARCHDHKFDSITVQDYYALAGVFASTRAADRAMASGVDSIQIFDAHKLVQKCETDLKKLDAEIKKLESTIKPLQDKPDSELTDDERKKRDEQGKALDDKRIAAGKLNEQIAQAKNTPGYDLPLTPGALDGTLEVKEAVGTHGSRIVYEPKPKDAAVEIRGNPNKTSDIVPRRFVSVLSKHPPQPFTQGSGRLELAETMFHDSSALIARVWINRIWKQHFGVGLVDTPSDFGVQGTPPTHPELLDDLARRFIDSGWSTKWLHREIILSQTYLQICRTHASLVSHGSEAWYVGAPLRRLDIEQWRDAILMVTGSINFEIGGKPTELSVTDNNRRTLYGLVRRRELSDILRLNDFPDPLTHSPNRSPTTTPLQQLFVLNSPFMQQQSAALVARLEREAPASDHSKIELAHRILFSRPATEGEVELGLQFVRGSSKEAWQQYAQVLLGSNEFLFVD